MKRKIITTADGSSTIQIVDWDEPYHSKHGAIQEAYHVFIDHGLSAIKTSSIKILEMGFGTGLNALISLMEAENRKLRIEYTGIEAFPITATEWAQLNYIALLKAPQHKEHFEYMHTCPWEVPCRISDHFFLTKRELDFVRVRDEACYDLVYFDAFGARVQPELWTELVFGKMHHALKGNGVLVTYSAKG
ncbi:MAG TPA: tRNA (5-methylaminomethyl-2-thiouridine)(34)-methyltransferase MnmD, partial [Eudoraea sp.]|nr:tRNA (5-methylaminomethyl-2-thiouridine)(34)-methyltransferase MnmD [Eudoraea sp.]